MSSSTTKGPTGYNKSELSKLKDANRNDLTNRKLNTEFYNIQNLVVQANNAGKTSIEYIYIYLKDESMNDYFVDLLGKLAYFFSDSVISYIIDVHTDMAAAIRTAVVLAKAEATLSALNYIDTSKISNNELNDALTNAKSAHTAIQATQEVATSIHRNLADTPSAPSATPAQEITYTRNIIPPYENISKKNDITNIIKIGWA
jgi:hypothetical protein